MKNSPNYLLPEKSVKLLPPPKPSYKVDGGVMIICLDDGTLVTVENGKVVTK